MWLKPVAGRRQIPLLPSLSPSTGLHFMTRFKKQLMLEASKGERHQEETSMHDCRVVMEAESTV